MPDTTDPRLVSYNGSVISRAALQLIWTFGLLFTITGATLWLLSALQSTAKSLPNGSWNTATWAGAFFQWLVNLPLLNDVTWMAPLVLGCAMMFYATLMSRWYYDFVQQGKIVSRTTSDSGPFGGKYLLRIEGYNRANKIWQQTHVVSHQQWSSYKEGDYIDLRPKAVKTIGK